MSPLTPKAWLDFPATSTPISADALIDIETRLGAYTDLVGDRVGGLEATSAVVAAPTGVAATDTAAIQAALTAAGTSGATDVHLREGDYSFTSLTFPVTALGTVKLIGRGIGKTTLTCTGTSGHAVAFGDGGATNTQRAFLYDMTIVGNANMDGAVKFNHQRFCGLTRVKVQDFTKAGAIGLDFIGAVHNYFALIEHCQFTNIPIGIKLDGGTGIGANSNYIQFCHFGNHSSYAVLVEAADSNVLLGNEFNGSITTAIRIQNAALSTKVIANQFDGPGTSVDIASAATTDTQLIGNTTMGTIVDSGTRTFRMDSTGTQGLVLSSTSSTAARTLFWDSSTARLSFVNTASQTVSVGSTGRLARTTDYTMTGKFPWDVIAYTALAAPRTVTLPAASTEYPGRIFTFKDEANGAAANNLTIARAGADTIEGATSVVISTNYGVQRLYSDGTSKWFKC